MSGHGDGAGLAAELVAREPWFVPGTGEPWLSRLNVPRIAYRVALVAFILIGIYFRSRRYWIDPLGLWVDEATWGIRLFRRSLTQLEFRPIGYMALTKLIVTIYSDERTLRLLSYVAGVASLLISTDLARYLFRSRLVRVLCVAVVAYNPLLIDMAREFKPYSVEFCVHLGLVWLFVRWRARRSPAWLGALLACSVLAFPFAYNIVFLLPGLFALLGYTFLRAKAHRALLATICAALAAVAVMVAIYVSALRVTTEDSGGTEQFWGKKYDVFYLPTAQQPNHATSRLRWVAHKYCDLAAFPGSHGNRPLRTSVAAAESTRKLAEVGGYAWLGLHALGLVVLLAYRRQWLLLLSGPLLVSIAFNALSLWPFGAFRSNVFLLAYLVLIPMVGLDVLLKAHAAIARLAGALGSALLLVTNLSAGLEPHIRKHFFSTQTEMADLVARMASVRAQQPSSLRRHATPVVLDSYSCAPFIFEATYSDSAKREVGSFLKDIDVRCMSSVSATKKLLHNFRGEPFFVVVSDERTMTSYAKMLRTQSTIIDHEAIRDTHDLYFVTAR
jgi:Dolichyl-phosphate-mannose-protein mannosyltransferase